MKIQSGLHGTAAAFKRAVSRASTSTELAGAARSSRRWVRALLRSGEQGSALVEFTLIAPMLLLLTTGIFVFGIAMNNYMQLTNAVSIAARTMAISANITTDPCATAYTAVTSAAPGLNPSSMTFTLTLNGTTYTGTTCNTTAAQTNLATGTTATLTVTYPFNLSVFGKVFSQSNAVLEASATELVQ
jgi:Flp pilus assembly protein TadG